ncbi:MAG TPA: NAD(P)(+) transhydrogenase (Re/Si-specific) subunit alpha, partial [Spirochaetia bacterium]|nr:NAD(P)(+) transhydrogenase (Re/Si-specific) subunit alpha [Spirochaetia bacterium]
GGGNCELSTPGQTTVCHGVTIMAPINVPSLMPQDASALFSRNLLSFVLAFWSDAESRLNLDPEDEIIKGALVVRSGEIVHEPTRKALGETQEVPV